MYRLVLRTTLPAILVLLLSTAGFGQKVVQEEEPGIESTRNELSRMLERYPPRFSDVLRLDHSLLTNQDYLAPYPEFRGFLQRHPEIVRDPDFFIGTRENERDHEIEALRERIEFANIGRRSTLDNLLNVMGPMTVFFTVVGVLIWAVKLFQDQRRWLRVWRAQTEAHSKLMDRLTTSEDTLAYLQTPAGKKFFEASTMVVEPNPQRFSVPVGRILWSAQAGLVFFLGGIALLFATTGSSLNPEDHNVINVMSAIAIGLGISFILGAGASYMISAKLGLFEQMGRRPSSSVEPPTPS